MGFDAVCDARVAPHVLGARLSSRARRSLDYAGGISGDDHRARANGGTPGHFARIVFAGLVLAAALGLPSFTAASNLSTGALGIGAVLKAVFGALVAGAITAALTRGLVREIWSGWVGVLGGVVPASLAGTRGQQLRAAAAYALGGAALVALGTSTLRTALGSASIAFGFYGLLSTLVGIAIALAGGIPRLVFARREHSPAQPDEAVSRHVWLFLTLALAGLGLSSGLAETLPASLYAASGIPLRTGAWNRGCVSSLVFEDTPCPSEQRYLVVGDRERDVALEWELIPGRCEIVVDDGERRRVFDADAGWLALHVATDRDIVVSFVGLATDACWYRVRERPPREGP